MSAMNSEFGLKDSLLGSLPPELRVEIWNFVFAGGCFTLQSMGACRMHYINTHSLSKTISLLQTCKEVRREAKELFMPANPFAIDVSRVFNELDQGREEFNPQARSRRLRLASEELKAIPFLPAKTTLLLRIVHRYAKTSLQDMSPQSFAGATAQYLQAVLKCLKPVQIIANVTVSYHRCADHSPETEKNVSSRRIVCRADAPSSINTCGILRLQVDIGASRRSRIETVETVCESLRQHLGAHAEHKLCIIRAERRNFLAGLEAIRRPILCVVAGLPDMLADTGVCIAESPDSLLSRLPRWRFPELQEDDEAWS